MVHNIDVLIAQLQLQEMARISTALCIVVIENVSKEQKHKKYDPYIIVFGTRVLDNLTVVVSKWH